MNPGSISVRNLEDGFSLAEIVKLFPGVTQEQACSVLKHSARCTTAAVSSVSILFNCWLENVER
jgi:hypothetical protein